MIGCTLSYLSGIFKTILQIDRSTMTHQTNYRTTRLTERVIVTQRARAAKQRKSTELRDLNIQLWRMHDIVKTVEYETTDKTAKKTTLKHRPLGNADLLPLNIYA